MSIEKWRGTSGDDSLEGNLNVVRLAQSLILRAFVFDRMGSGQSASSWRSSMVTVEPVN